MRLIASLIALMALFGFVGLLSLIGGLLLGYWHSERLEESYMHYEPSCDNCYYNNQEWNEDPCDSCTNAESRWEAIE